MKTFNSQNSFQLNYFEIKKDLFKFTVLNWLTCYLYNESVFRIKENENKEIITLDWKILKCHVTPIS